MIKKKYLCVAVALALSSIYAQAEEINSTIEQNTPYVKDDVTVTWKGSLTASSITVTNKFDISGSVTSNSDLTAGTIQISAASGSIKVKDKLNITGTGNSLVNYYGKIEANELHFDQPSTLLNRGTIKVESLTGCEGVVITNHLGQNNQSGTKFVITNIPTNIGGLINKSAFKVGSAGDVLNVTGNVVNENGAAITAVNGEAIGLDVGGLFHNQSALTLTELTVGGFLKNDADLTVTGNTTVNTGLSVAEGKTFTIDGNLDVSSTPYNDGEAHSLSPIEGNLIVHGNANVATGLVYSTGGLTVDGVLTITGQWFQYQGESSKFNVDHIVMDHQPGRKDSAVLSLEGEGDYHLTTLELKNSTNETERFNGVQLHNANLSVKQMLVNESTVGMIHFEQGTQHKADITNLTVAENGTFHVGAINGSLSDQSQNKIVVANASFADNTKITRKNEYDEDEKVEKDGDVGLIFKNLTAEGSLAINSMDSLKGGHGALTIENLHANGGAVIIGQSLEGQAAVVNIAEGASVAMNKGTTVDSLTVNMSTLAKDSLYVDSVGTNTKTNINVDGALNNKDPESILEELDAAVQIGKDDKGNYDFVIEEGDVFGEITGNHADYERAQNKKLAGLASVTAVSALTLRHEMNSLSKRMGELRDAPAGVGAWARAYGSEMEYGKQNVKAKNTSIQVGSDYTIGDWKVGAAFTFTDGDSSYTKGTADNKGYGVALYGTWFVPCGAYVDLIAKYNRLDTDFGFDEMKGSYKNDAFGLSAETGYRFNFLDGAFVEPQLGLSYGRMTGDTFVTSNGVTIEQDDYNSLIGRLGVRTGFKFPKDKGMIYARVSGVYDFKGSMDATATKGDQHGTMSEDLGGAWLEMGLGANFNWTDRTYTYIDLERTNGGHVKENYRWNIGVRHTF